MDVLAEETDTLKEVNKSQDNFGWWLGGVGEKGISGGAVSWRLKEGREKKAQSSDGRGRG